MNLVDSSGWLEYFSDGPNTHFFAPPIEDAKNLVIPSICILEVFKRILQQRTEDAALQSVAVMKEGLVVNLDDSIALSAAKLGVDLKLSLADSVILATARANHALIWTQDADFCEIEGVKYIKKKEK